MKKDNVFKKGIDEAKSLNKDIYSNKNIAYALHVGESTVSNYCNGFRAYNPESIRDLAVFTHNFKLMNEYCCTECPIGIRQNPNGFDFKDLSTSGWMMKSSINDMAEMLSKIEKDMADGEIDRYEQMDLKENILPDIHKAISTLHNIADIIEGY